MYFVCTQAKAGGGGQKSNGDFVFPISPLFPNPSGPRSMSRRGVLLHRVMFEKSGENHSTRRAVSQLD